MAFEGLEKTPEVAPLLVRLYDTHNLYALAENKDSDEACTELATVMVDLLNIRLSDRESELITDVLLALMKQAQQDLKAALADRLSSMEDVPLRMILSLANEDINIADSVLVNSPVLQDLDLIYILQSKGVSHGRSIAKRKGLSGELINMLADTKDFEVAVNLSGNDGAVLTEHAFRIISDMAKYNEDIARPLLLRDDVPQEVAGKLYQFVSDELKKVMKQRYGIGAERMISALDEVSVEMIDAGPPSEESSQDHLLAYAHNQLARGDLKVYNMVAVLRRGQYATFLAQFSVFCGVPVQKMLAALKEETGKGLAISCRAKDVPKSEFVSLYLLTERFRSHTKRVINHRELSRIMAMFDGINPEHARKVLEQDRH